MLVLKESQHLEAWSNTQVTFLVCLSSNSCLCILVPLSLLFFQFICQHANKTIPFLQSV